MAPKKKAKTVLQAVQEPTKKVKILQKQDTDTETPRSVYDNLIKHGYTKDDIDVRIGSDGKTARQAIRTVVVAGGTDFFAKIILVTQ